MTGKRVERLQIMLNEEELAAIDEWRFRHRMPSRSAAVRAMLNVAIRTAPPPPPGNEPNGGVAPSREVGVLPEGTAAQNNKRRIVVIEPARVSAAGITTLLEEAGHEVVAVLTGLDNWRETSFKNQPDCGVIGDGLTDEAACRMAEELARHGIPHVYFRSDADKPVPARLGDAPLIDAKSSADSFNESLARACAQ